jgi:DMSO/TMAO reductase YedYZ molybdopterin-dependent catalytic subunit
MTWLKHSTREIVWCPPTPNPRLPRSRTTTTELRLTLVIISGWNLLLDGLASGLSVSLEIRSLLTRFSVHEQITRLVCVEGWSAIAWWAGLRFDDLLRARPPVSQAKWAGVESSVNLDASGNPDPYFMSLDLATASHPQTLLATHLERSAPYCGSRSAAPSAGAR